MIARLWRRVLGPTVAAPAPAYPAFDDPGTDPIGTQRYASPQDVFAWVKTDYDRWVHVGGWAVRTDRQVRTFMPGTMRAHRVDPGPWPR